MCFLLSEKCKNDEYICDSGQCVDAKKLCDSNFDCYDESDEGEEKCGKCKSLIALIEVEVGCWDIWILLLLTVSKEMETPSVMMGIST